VKKTLISGITGQDGSYLTEYILNWDMRFTVLYVESPQKIPPDPTHHLSKLERILSQINLHSGFFRKFSEFFSILEKTLLMSFIILRHKVLSI